MFNRLLTTAALAMGLGVSTSALHADTTPIFKAPLSSLDASKSKRFAINPELGRAWVEIEVWHNFSETTEFHRVQIPGLSYSKDTAQVVFTEDDKTVVCAEVESGGFWIFKHERINPTGDCELTRKYVKVPVDDGFSVDVIEHFEVHFKPASRVGLVPVVKDMQS